MLNNLLDALEEVYIKREIIPKMWDRTSEFYKNNVWPDLIELGEKIHHTKKTHSKARAIGMIFFPRSIREFKTFETDMDKIVDKFEEKNPPKVIQSDQEIAEAPTMATPKNVENIFQLKEKKYPYTKKKKRKSNKLNGANHQIAQLL